MKKATDQYFSLTLMFLSLSFSSLSPASKNKQMKSLKSVRDPCEAVVRWVSCRGTTETGQVRGHCNGVLQ